MSQIAFAGTLRLCHARIPPCFVSHFLRLLAEVRYLMDYYFSDPQKSDVFPGVVMIGTDATWDPCKPAARGLLRAISPEEPRHALILAIARDVKAGMPEEGLLLWRCLLVSVITELCRLSTEEDVFWAATNLRERVGADCETMCFSPFRASVFVALCCCLAVLRSRIALSHALPRKVQRIFQLAGFKARREAVVCRAISAEQVAVEFNARVTVSSGEAVTQTLVDTALTVWERIFRDEACRQSVMWALALGARQFLGQQVVEGRTRGAQGSM